MRRIILLLLILLSPPAMLLANDGGYRYKDISVEAFVHKDNTWDITMTQTVEFLEPRHGIYVYIPYRFKISQPVMSADGKGHEQRLLTYRAHIDDVAVSGYEYTEDDEDDCHIIKIGDKDVEVTGTHTYVIRYRYRYPADRTPLRDCLFHTILGTNYPAPIASFSYNVRFEKPLPEGSADSLQVFSGPFSSATNACGVTAIVTPERVSGMASGLAPNNGVTLYVPLPEGYYEGASAASSWPMAAAAIACGSILILLVVTAITRRRPAVTRQIEFYPPEGISSAEVGTIIDSTADTEDLASLIPWLASQGHVVITERGHNDNPEGKKKLYVKLIKKLPSDAPAYMRRFVKAIFAKNDEVCLDDLTDAGKGLVKAQMLLGKHFSGERKLEHTSWWMLLYPLLAVGVTLLLALSSPIEHFEPETSGKAIALWLFPYAVAFVMMLAMHGQRYVMKARTRRIIHIIVIGLFLVGGVFHYVFRDADLFLPPSASVLIYVLGYASVTLVGRFIRDTPYRAMLMGKLLGLKEFIETAEKDRLETLLESDPQYFYRIMPYALVFGLTDKWTEHFRTLTVAQPEWFRSDSHALFTAAYLGSVTHNVCKASSIAVSSATMSATETTSSSGGFSGGGGGGGGGGSW
ncbi:MAG: DUF2207 family protein [Prevotella sp.]